MTGKPIADRHGIGDGLTIGTHSYFRPRVEWQWGDGALVQIGNYSSIAQDSVMMVGGIHPSEWVSTFAFRTQFGVDGMFEDGMPRSNGDIVIGNDVYVGREAKVLSGVQISDGAIVGAYAVVAKPVRPYAIVVGNPASEIGRRFTDDQVDRLLRIRWWDWPEDRVREAIPLLSSPDITGFLDRYDPR